MIDDFEKKLDLDPDHVIYKKIAADNKSVNTSQFRIDQPSARALCFAFALWEVDVQVTQSRAGAGVNYVLEGANRDVLGLSAVAPIQTKACTNMNINWGGYNRSIAGRDMLSCIQKMFVGRSGSKSLGNEFSDMHRKSYSAETIETAATRFDSRLNFPIAVAGADGNSINFDGGADVAFTSANATRDQMLAVLNAFLRNMHDGSALSFENEDDPPLFQRSVSLASKAVVNPGNVLRIKWMEPLFIPPFNPLAILGNESDLPDYCWFKNMSPMIPYFHNVQLQIDYNKLETAFDYVRNADRANTNHDITATDMISSNLHVWFYEPPKSYPLSASYNLPTWNYQQRVSAQSTAMIAGAAEDLSVNNIRLTAVPTLITIHVGLNKADVNYRGRSFRAAAAEGSCRDDNCRVETMTLSISTRNQTLDASLTPEEMYYLTIKNSNRKDFPFDFTQWYEYGQNFIALRPEDISSEFPAGVVSGDTIDVQVTCRNTSHHTTRRFYLYVTLYYGDEYIIVSRDKNIERSSSISTDTALRSLGYQGATIPSEGLSYSSRA